MADQDTDDHASAGAPAAESGWWRIHAMLVEAAALLILARLLVSFVRFGRWRGTLGDLTPTALPDGLSPEPQMPGQHDRYLSRVVVRAATRLPFACRCLPRAMALQWMLMRRARHPTLVIGILPGPRRGSLDDLHAWVELGGEVLIGESVEPYAILARLQR